MVMSTWQKGLLFLCSAILPALVPLAVEMGETRETAQPWGADPGWSRAADLMAQVAGAPGNVEPPRGLYDDLIARMSSEEGVDANLVHAIITMESKYDRLAVSRKGAKGLMQLRADAAARYAVRDPFDPAANIRGGMRHLRFLQELFSGRLPWVLAAYNAGESAVLRHKGIPPFRETRNYVTRVLAHYAQRAAVTTRTALSLGSVGSGRAIVQAIALPEPAHLPARVSRSIPLIGSMQLQTP
jgi:soluble lytic murein transglycosylase-like protein